MKFFDRELSTRRQSAFLLFGFIVAMLCMGLVIHGVIAGLSILVGDSSRFTDLSAPALALIGLVWLTVFAGAFFRALDVRAGGAVLARRFGAVHASDRSRFDKEQQLLNVVAEMSIAASTPQPDVYVLRNESSINAFVLGSQVRSGNSKRHVIVLTQGALDAFNRDELQAVVAHEFGHITNGDLPLNMNLLIALGGLMAIDEVGRILIGDDPNENAHPGMLLGYLLRAIGSVGVFFGELIRAAYSRQREYLADATAVRYSRNPFALASALSVIKQRDDQRSLHNAHVQELAHLCFQSGRDKPWYQRFLASHPTVQKRIDAIDPHFSVKQRKAKKSPNRSAQNNHFSGVDDGTPDQVTTVNSAGFGPTTLAHDGTHEGLSDRVLLLLPDKTSSLAMLFALFASRDLNKRRDYLNAISFGFSEQFGKSVKKVLELIPDELQKDQVAIIDHATAILCNSLPQESRQKLVLKLERLLTVSGDYNLMSYACLQLIRRKLDVDFPVINTLASDSSTMAQGRRTKTFDAMGSEFALLLSLMVESSGASQAEQDEEFARVLKCYTQTVYPRRTCNETGIVDELEAAFQTLYVQPKSIREAFVQHCIEIVQRDGYVGHSERALLDLFAASLGCEYLAAA